MSKQSKKGSLEFVSAGSAQGQTVEAAAKEAYVHYLGKSPAPGAIRLSDPFNNCECLHCHLGARSFEEDATHNAKPYLLPAVKGNDVSCLSSGRHQTVHNIAALNKATFWKGHR